MSDFAMPITKIMIIGGPGAGKSWLAKRLASRYALPLYAVDDAVWDSNGAVQEAGVIDTRLRKWIAQDKWIIEGGNTRTYLERARRADVIIRLVPPRWQRLYRVLRREGWNRDLLHWTLRYDAHFGSKDSQAIIEGKGSAICIQIQSDKEVRRLLHLGIERY